MTNLKYDPKTDRILPDYYPMHQFNFPPEMSVEDPGFIVRRNISVQFANMLDNEIMTAIVNLARENGITDLFVLDKKFVLDALKEKLEREGLR